MIFYFKKNLRYIKTLHCWAFFIRSINKLLLFVLLVLIICDYPIIINLCIYIYGYTPAVSHQKWKVYFDMEDTHQILSSTGKKTKLSSFLSIMKKLDDLTLELPLPATEEQKHTKNSSVSNPYSLLSLDGSPKFLKHEMSLTLADLGITSNEFVSRKLFELDAPQTALNEKFESTLKDKIKANINEILDKLNNEKSELLPNISIDWTDFKQKCMKFLEIIDYTENSTSFNDVFNFLDNLSTKLASFTLTSEILLKKSDFLLLLLNVDTFLNFDEVSSKFSI